MKTTDWDAQPVPSGITSLQTVMATSMAQEGHDLVCHLARVLDVKADEHVLLIPGDAGVSALTLVNTFGCTVSVLSAPQTQTGIQPADDRVKMQVGTLDALPFEAGTFDAVIVTIPPSSGVQRIARELARVLKLSGRLGLVALSMYQDQIGEDALSILQQFQGSQIRPAAAYRAVLAEAGFTAFLSEDRRRELRRSAEAIYREHILESPANHATLGVLAAGGMSMTLITAEKGI